MFFKDCPYCFDGSLFIFGFHTGIIAVTVPFTSVERDNRREYRVTQAGCLEVFDDAYDLQLFLSSFSVSLNNTVPDTDLFSDRVVYSHDPGGFFIDDGCVARRGPVFRI